MNAPTPRLFSPATAAAPASGHEPVVVGYDRELRLLWSTAGASAGGTAGAMPTCLNDGGAAHCGEACPVRRCLAAGVAQEAGFRLVDGRQRQVRAEPLFDAAGRIAGVVEFLHEPAGPAAGAEAGPDLLAVVESITDAVFVHEAATGAILLVNDAACRMYGYEREALLACELGALGAGEPPYSGADVRRWLERARTEGPQVFEWRARARDGRLFWAEIGVRFARIAAGGRFFVTVRDISRRKAAEERLRVSEANFRGLLGSVSEAVCVQDETGAILEVNPAFERASGRPRSALAGCRPQDIAAPGRNDLVEEDRLLGRALAGEPQQFEYWIRRADGTDCPYEVSLTAGLFSGQRVVVAVLRDITERKQLEAERERAAAVLRQSEERFRLLLGRVPTVAVQGYGPDGTVRYWNEASEHLYGHPAAAVLGRNLLELIVPPPLRDEVRRAVHQMADTGQPAPAGENQRLRQDGSLVTVFSSHAVVVVPGAGPELYCLDIDLTERQREEERRLDLERRLLHAQKLESLGVLAGGIAHDFNNLLTGVLGNLELARLDLPEDAAMRPLVDDAIQAARLAADLTHQMLAYAGRGRFQLRTLDLNQLVRDHAHLLGTAISRSVTFHLQLAPEVPPVEADAGQIQQVLVNLVTNAAEAIGRQPGAVELRTSVVEVTAGQLAGSRIEEKPAPGRFVCVEIVDTGCGMDAAVQQRLFEPFFSTKFAGRGLGMPVVLGIVRAHHGALFVESQPRRGTVVRLLLPALAPVPAAAVVGEAGHRPAEPFTGLVLLVDDEEPVRKIAQRMGQRVGFEVLVAADGEEGIELFRRHAARIACVILDLTMPTMNGIECLRALRTIQPDVPAVLSSGFAEDNIAIRYADAGFSGFMQKPFTSEKFATAIRSAVDGRR